MELSEWLLHALASLTSEQVCYPGTELMCTKIFISDGGDYEDGCLLGCNAV
jgi:hypothetical protein